MSDSTDLDEKRRDRSNALNYILTRTGSTGRPRSYPEAKIGDRFGDRVVIKLLPRGYRSRSDERVGWRCTCGVEGEAYVFNLRVNDNRCGRHRRDDVAAFNARRGAT